MGFNHLVSDAFRLLPFSVKDTSFQSRSIRHVILPEMRRTFHSLLDHILQSKTMFAIYLVPVCKALQRRPALNILFPLQYLCDHGVSEDDRYHQA